MSHSPESKIRGAVLGLAFGDAMSFPSTTHRLRLLNVKRSNRMISLTQFAFDQKQNTYPTVYTHAQSVEFSSLKGYANFIINKCLFYLTISNSIYISPLEKAKIRYEIF